MLVMRFKIDFRFNDFGNENFWTKNLRTFAFFQTI